MRILVNERLSDHRFKTPEGYLVCTDAILARTGKQTYKRGEVFGQDCKDADSYVEVDRTEKEVFSDATLASFENKPLTVEHPDENVNAENHNRYAVGYVRDVKRSKVDGQDVMTGTLVITDAQTIQEIEDGEHTDLSCGYDCDISDDEHPQQRNIRGNHVALCQQGRAGIARIIDSVEDENKTGKLGPMTHHKLKELNVPIEKRRELSPEQAEALIENLENKKEESSDENEINTVKLNIIQKEQLKEKLKGINNEKLNYLITGEWVHPKSLEGQKKELIEAAYKKLLESKDLKEMNKKLSEVKAGEIYDSSRSNLSQELTDTIEKLKGMQEMKDDINFFNVKKKNAADKWLKQKGLYEEFLNKGLYKKYTDYEYAIMKGMPKIEDSIKDAPVTNVIRAIPLTTNYIALQDEHGYLVVLKNKYHGEKAWTGGGTYEITLNGAKSIAEDYEIMDKLEKKYGEAEGRKRWLAGYDDSINDGYGIMSSGQEAKLRRYCDHYDVDFKKAYDELKKRFDKKPYLSIDRILEVLCDDIANDDFKDSIKDVNPREGESKDDFISRFMSETKNEYPDQKQRYAVALSYWDKNKVMKSKGKDSSQWYRVSIPGENQVHLVKATSIEDAINKLNRR